MIGLDLETDPLDLERFAEMLADSGLAPISQGRTLAAIRSFFRFSERIGFCRNVASWWVAALTFGEPVEIRRAEPDLIDRIANALPDEVRADIIGSSATAVLLHPSGQQKVYWHGRSPGKHLDCGQ